MKILQPYIYEVIHKLISEKKKNQSFPVVASINEIITQVISDVKTTITELEDDGVLSHYENINGIKMFRQEEIK